LEEAAVNWTLLVFTLKSGAVIRAVEPLETCKTIILGWQKGQYADGRIGNPDAAFPWSVDAKDVSAVQAASLEQAGLQAVGQPQGNFRLPVALSSGRQ
jgi:hypothetical protein